MSNTINSENTMSNSYTEQTEMQPQNTCIITCSSLREYVDYAQISQETRRMPGTRKNESLSGLLQTLFFSKNRKESLAKRGSDFESVYPVCRCRWGLKNGTISYK